MSFKSSLLAKYKIHASDYRCDMEKDCERPVTYMDDRGYLYCTEHGQIRDVPCRELNSTELKLLDEGKREKISFEKPAPAAKKIGSRWYHLTDRAKFKLDPKFTPSDNAFALEDRSGRTGIYLAPNIEPWLRKGYWRPFVVEFHVDPSVANDPGIHGRWGGEMFVPASSFGKLAIKRVIPLDAYAREEYGDYGWIESKLEREFDTEKPIVERRMNNDDYSKLPSGYKYTGKDVRNMSTEETTRLKKQLREAKKSGLS